MEEHLLIFENIVKISEDKDFKAINKNFCQIKRFNGSCQN